MKRQTWKDMLISLQNFTKIDCSTDKNTISETLSDNAVS